MKKTIALFSSLLIFAGVKAQTPTVKKETVKPAALKPSVNADALKATKYDKITKVTNKVSKIEHIKKTNADIPFKESLTKPDKR